MQKILFTTLLVFISFVSFSQIKATTEDGKEVLLMRDGTWQYADKPAKSVSFDCASLTKTTSDGSSSNDVLWVEGQGGKRIGIVLTKSKDGSIALLLNPDGASNCTQKGSAINITYRDGKTLKLSNDMEANCNKRVSSALGTPTRDNATINDLKNKEIASMNVFTKEGSVMATFDPQQSKIFLNTLWCMSSTK